MKPLQIKDGRRTFTEEQLLTAIDDRLAYLLSDWKSNIKNFDIVQDDIRYRMKTGVLTELKQVISKKP